MIKYRGKGGYSSNPSENDGGLEHSGKWWNSLGVVVFFFFFEEPPHFIRYTAEAEAGSRAATFVMTDKLTAVRGWVGWGGVVGTGPGALI